MLSKNNYEQRKSLILVGEVGSVKDQIAKYGKLIYLTFSIFCPKIFLKLCKSFRLYFIRVSPCLVSHILILCSILNIIVPK